MSDAGGPAYPIESVDRALSLLLMFEDTDWITITETSRRLGVSRSTAYRLLNLLEHREFVRQDKVTKAFRAGSAMMRIGLAAVQRSDLRASLHPLLEEVVGQVDETAHVVVLQRTDCFFMDCVECSKMVRATSRVGSALPAHLTAGGKVLLANLSPERIDELVTGKLPALTRRSKVSPKSVKRELAKVRREGWATNVGETEDGLTAVAVLVPAASARGGVDAAVTIAGPFARLSSARQREIAEIAQGLVRGFVDRERLEL